MDDPRECHVAGGIRMNIRTNNHWRDFVYRWDVPAEILESQFDYQDENDTYDGFIHYKGHWYHLDQFLCISPGAPDEFGQWQGYSADSYFSGVLVRISDNGEQYQIATYIS